ncbi:MAG: MFS transporter [Rhodospirillales bacterium]|nr:MFS transporter [Rhodospirillales bacterium]
MTPNERRATGCLAAVFAVRLLGLFMIYPVFEAYARGLPGASPAMIGLALGAYGLTQGLLQIPFGLLSDRIGRKIMITIGLLFFAGGSVIAARAGSIEGVLFGRILQGAGAVGSVVLALVADLTRQEVRTRAMAMVGVTIGLAFVVAIVVGPILNAVIGVPGIFWLTAVLALAGIAITLGLVPSPERLVVHRESEAVPALISRVLVDRELLRLDVGIFSLHAILTASFLAVPTLLAAAFGTGASREWMIYLPVLVASVALMVPAVILAERRGMMKEVFITAIAVLAASVFALGFAGDGAVTVIVALVLFFAAFNSMEAMLPSLVSRFAPPDAKGTAMGVYSSMQFLGIFAGGAIGGVALSWSGPRGVCIFATLVALAWLGTAVAMPKPAGARGRTAGASKPREARGGDIAR